jgi:hypothetical protein
LLSRLARYQVCSRKVSGSDSSERWRMPQQTAEAQWPPKGIDTSSWSLIIALKNCAGLSQEAI